MKKLILLSVSVLLGVGRVAGSGRPAGPGRPAYFELKVYHVGNGRQEALLDSFLRRQYVPAAHAAGLPAIGVFKVIGIDTARDKRVYVFTPVASLRQWEKTSQQLTTRLLAQGGSYVNAAPDAPAYNRLETILLKSFDQMEAVAPPSLAAPKAERVYELRSYEGASEKLFRNKVQMFNAGGEVKLFNRLGFNALFYGEVLYGSKMPNLMYMTTFANKAAREAHWQAFGGDPEWKRLSALPEYQHNVSHIDITFLRPTDYSDL